MGFDLGSECPVCEGDDSGKECNDETICWICAGPILGSVRVSGNSLRVYNQANCFICPRKNVLCVEIPVICKAHKYGNDDDDDDSDGNVPVGNAPDSDDEHPTRGW